MISKEAVKRGYNRGDYVVGAPTPPFFAQEHPKAGSKSLQSDPVSVPAAVLEQLRTIADEVLTSEQDVINGTRDWWANSMIQETGGNPPATRAAIVKVSSEEQVREVVRLAAEHKIPVTASAARSNVTGAALPLRGGIVLDVCGLNRIGEFDETSQIIEVEAGVFGDVFEEYIQREHGMTMGHWPSSYGISTVGGWVACRGAGQLSTRYGKIEHMVYGLDVVLPDGRLVSVGDTPAAAIGPSLVDLFVGAEGTLGIITKARLRLHRLPDYGRAVAYGFDSFAAGLEACRQIMQNGATPAVLRLYDNLESGVQFDLPNTNVLLIADEGNSLLVDAGLEVAEAACREFGTKLDGETIFERWLDTRYLTGKSSEGFVRSPGFVSDTLEMTGRWRDLPAIYDELVAAVKETPGTLAGSAHQSHAYVDGACVYFSLRGEVPVEERETWYKNVWSAANAIVLKYDATLSHHHGVGLLRGPYMRATLGEAFGVLENLKVAVDPDNLFNPGKLGLPV